MQELMVALSIVCVSLVKKQNDHMKWAFATSLDRMDIGYADPI
jgi:hypothetical protein